MLADRPPRQFLVAQVDQEGLAIRDDLLAWQKIFGQPHPASRPLIQLLAVGQPGGLLDGHDLVYRDRAVSGVGLKPTLEFGLLRSEVLTARGYPEVDGDGPEVHPAIMYDFIGRSNRALWGSQKPQKNQDTAQLFQRTLQVGHCLIASGPAALSVGFCTVAIVTPITAISTPA